MHTLAQPSKQQRALSRQSRSLTPTLQQLDWRPAQADRGGRGPGAGHLGAEAAAGAAAAGTAAGTAAEAEAGTAAAEELGPGACCWLISGL